MSDYDRSIHTNPDARAWAQFFMKTWIEIGKPEPNEDWMLGWFANAMMAMHDHLRPNDAPIVLPDGSAFFTATVEERK